MAHRKRNMQRVVDTANSDRDVLGNGNGDDPKKQASRLDLSKIGSSVAKELTGDQKMGKLMEHGKSVSKDTRTSSQKERDKRDLDRQTRIQDRFQRDQKYHNARKRQENTNQGYFIDETTGKKEYPNKIREFVQDKTYESKKAFLKQYEETYKNKSPEERKNLLDKLNK